MSPLKKQNSFEEKLKEQLDGMEWKPSDSLWSRIEKNMDADSFEPALQKKLSDYSVEPRKEVWEGVESQLPDGNNRKGFLWFSSIALLLLATFGAGYWFKQTTTTHPLAQVEIVSPSKSESSATPRVQSQDHAQATDLANTPKSQYGAVADLQNAPEPENRLSKPETENTEPVQLNVSNAIGSDQNRNSTRVVKKNHISKREFRSVTTNEEKQNSDNNSGNVIPPVVSDREMPALEPKQPESLAILDPIANSQSKLKDSGTIAETPAPPVNLPGLVNNKGSEPKLILESVTINNQPKDSFEENKVFRGSSYIAPEETFTDFSLTAFAGAHMSFMKLGMPSSSSYGNLQKSYDLRKEMESPALDFSGGLLLNYHFGKGWFVASGIGISSFKQSVNFNVMPAVQSNPALVQPKNLYIHSGDSILSGNSNTLENKYSFTEIPLWLGYQFPSEGNFHLELLTGLSLGKLNLINSYMPDPGCIGILLANDKESFPEYKNVFFASFAPSVSYKLNSTVELGLMPVAKIALNSMISNSQWIQQRPALVGLNFFLRKRF